VLANPHFRARRALVETADPELGTVTTAAPLPLRPAAPGTIRHLGRARGADNVAVYCDWLGLDDTELQALQAAGVI
jgi:crotonobetainyl-CoA:carnitine CoA-transferase CaiB-like acyl-CoA transferase